MVPNKKEFFGNIRKGRFMKISILTPDLSHNCLGRAYLLAKILQRRYKIEIVDTVFINRMYRLENCNILSNFKVA